ncbi:glycosyltransferase family 2 protein [Anaerostipes butyraticus]|uniref:glycosyltransferase family 2 protein n=1 Tax=Anaerostipes butyraticus TaxID=645466 RepID=UPI00320AB5BA
MQPLISIIIPVYNGEKFVKNCIESVRSQTIKELQIIAVDDGSNDCTLEILNDLATKDKRIMVIHQKNGGVSKARNTGLKFVKAKWVLFVDADDTIVPNYCTLMLNAANSLNADVIIARTFTEGVPHTYILQEKEELIQACLSYEETIYPFNIDAPWGKIFSYEVINKKHIFFPEELTRSEDAFFCLGFYEVANRIGILNELGYHHTEREGSICHSYMKDAPEILEKILCKNYQWVMENHAQENKYMRALWYRVLPGIVECEKSFFLHQDFSGSLLFEYQRFLNQKMVTRAIHALRFTDIKNTQYKRRLVFYKLHIGWLFLVVKKGE